ncbi:MAG: NF038129 family PEP-CTERM protein [Acidobacteriaceae bacterium]|nr:NF038129 family PEP-CTERM protein [Acidobacteriaceae bacterium]
MKATNKLKNTLGLLLCGSALLCASSARADYQFKINLNVASLIGNANAPFYLDFQLNDGSGTLAGVNTVTLSNFVLTGGSATGLATTFGTVTGNLGSTLTLTDNTGSGSEFYQQFTSNTQNISFNVSTTTNNDPTSPDLFAVGILDQNKANIPTTASDTSDTLVEAPISSTMSIASVKTFSSQSPDAGVTAAAAAVPEPSTWMSMVLGAAALILFKRRKLV